MAFPELSDDPAQRRAQLAFLAVEPYAWKMVEQRGFFSYCFDACTWRLQVESGTFYRYNYLTKTLEVVSGGTIARYRFKQ